MLSADYASVPLPGGYHSRRPAPHHAIGSRYISSHRVLYSIEYSVTYTSENVILSRACEATRRIGVSCQQPARRAQPRAAGDGERRRSVRGVDHRATCAHTAIVIRKEISVAERRRERFQVSDLE